MSAAWRVERWVDGAQPGRGRRWGELPAGRDQPSPPSTPSVVKVVLQWAEEAGLTDTAAALEAETGVHLNAVPSVAALAAAARAGAWDAVLPAASRLRLPPALVTDLYELVVLELVELREPDAARALLRAAPPLSALRAENPSRAARLDALVAEPVLDAAAIYGDTPRPARRAAVAAGLAAAAVSPPPPAC